MKKSIAKQFSVKILFFIVLALLLAGVIWFKIVKKSVMDNRIETTERTADAIRLYIYDYLDNKQSSMSEEDLTEDFRNRAAELCDNYGIDYLYVFLPDFEEGIFDYLLIAAKSDKSEEIPENYKEHNPEITDPEKFQKLWNGETDYVIRSYYNSYGEELGIHCLLKDSEGNRAFLGLDISYHMIYHTIIKYSIIGVAVALFFFLLFFFYIYRSMQKQILAPVKEVSQAMTDYAHNGCQTKESLSLGNYVEFAMLSDAFQGMTDEIGLYIDHIRRLSEEEEKRKAEMQIAEKMQIGLLPPPVFDAPQYKIRAMMKAAKDVGGDLYDYYEVDEDNLLLVIADVSGKGVAAAIFMSMTLTLIRQMAGMGKKPGEILTLVNQNLSGNNPQGMFVTAFIAAYHKPSDVMICSNAGHNPPYILRQGKLIKLSKVAGAPLGLFNDEAYTHEEIQLRGDDLLFMYTDGVNEAVNGQKEFFGIQRLEECLEAYDRNQDHNLMEYIYGQVKGFCGKEERHDDITMMVMAVNHRQELLLEASEKEFSKIKKAILESEIPKKYKLKICLACEEWFTNICMYSYDRNMQEKKVNFTLEISDRIKIVFEDWGKPYDPLKNITSREDYDFENQTGGLGKMIIVTIADQVDYRYYDGKNILTITKRIEEERT